MRRAGPGPGVLAVAGIGILLIALPLMRAAIVERIYGLVVSCNGCVRWSALGNDLWLTASGFGLMALALAVRQRVVRRLLLVPAFLIALAMLVDSIVLDVMNMRLYFADVLKFGGEVGATRSFLQALWAGGYLGLYAAMFALGLVLIALLLPLKRNPRLALAIALLAIAAGSAGAWLGRADPGHIHREAVVNLIQLQRMRGVNQPYSDEFARAILREQAPAAAICETGQGRRPDVILLIVESLSAHHSALLGGSGHVPEIDAIARANTWFSDFYANGFTTDHGLIALLDGRMPVPAVGRYLSARAFDGFGDPGHSVPGVLHPAGYQVAFLTTGTLDFLDKTAWLSRMGVDHFEGDRHPYYEGMPRGGFNAASDSALYGRFLQWMDGERDASRAFLAALLTVDSHPPFLDRASGALDEERIFRRADAAIGDFHRKLEARGFFERGILIITGDHRGMTAVAPEEWERYGESAMARVPFVVAGASGLPRGEISGAFQQTGLRPSLAQLVGTGQVCRHEGEDSFLRPDPRPPSWVLHARGDLRGRVDIHFPDGLAWLDLEGDRSAVGGAHPERAAAIAREIHRDRILRGEVPEDMVPLLLELSRQRAAQAR